MSDMIKYFEDITIPCYDSDASWCLKPVSFMNLAQEAAGRHADLLGFGYDNLITSDTAWILSRVHVQFVNPPKWRDKVRLATWHKGPDRLFFLRDFLLTDESGQVRVKATTSWLVLNLKTRRLVREPGLMEEGTVCRENVMDRPADKVQMPKDAVSVYVKDHVVSYSDVDMNGHTNNAMYMHWAMDSVEYEVSSAKGVKEFLINFNHETKPGDVVSLYRAEQEFQDGLHVFIEGKVEDKQAFCVEIVF